MAAIRPAGIFEALASLFSPKRLDVQVRTTVLENGDYAIKPVFFIDGREVPPEHVSADHSQKILGRYVVLTRQTSRVIGLTKGKPMRLAKSKAAALIEDLSQGGVAVRSRDGRHLVQLNTAKPDVSLELQSDDSLRVSSQLVTSEGEVIPKPKDIGVLQREDGWHAHGEDLIKVQLTGTPLDKVLIQEAGNGWLEGTNVPRFLKIIGSHDSDVGNVEKNPTLAPLSVITPDASHAVNVTGDDTHVVIEPTLTLATPTGVACSFTGQNIADLEKHAGSFQRVRDGWLEIDKGLPQRFKQSCDDLSLALGGRKRAEGTDIPKTLHALHNLDPSTLPHRTPWNVYFSEAVANSHRLYDQSASLEFRLNIVESNGRALLHLDPIYSHDRFRLSHPEVENAATSGDEWVRRAGAWVHIDDVRYAQVSEVAGTLGLTRSGDGYSFPANDRERVLNLFSTLGAIRQSEAYADFLSQLDDFQRIEEAPLPKNLRSTVRLRTYQQHGFNWLAFLQRFTLNGILADDMGLGKTLQTLTAIERARETGACRLPSLIICPATVMLNWSAEIRKFLESSDVAVYHGNARHSLIPRIHEMASPRNTSSRSCYVVTSYDTARIDCEILNRIRWLYVVVDEGHNIKNPDAHRTRAIKTIAGQHKLALTGTPIQNKLEELWSLFDFAMPGFLGTRAAFRQAYASNNRVDWAAVDQHLSPRIRPFVLRRLKKQVAQDLPDKLIVDHRAELTPKQVTLYKQAINSREYQKLVEELDSKGVARSQANILTVLTKLRNICNHPVFLTEGWRPADAHVEDSGKLDLLQELIEEIREGDHRALLFSQSTRVLDVLEHHFQDWGVRSLRIDGSTPPKQRVEMADDFNSNQSVHCFLLSTKAAGAGLNLIGADTVIFYDHDWNPANDNQAMDRAYRIGQTKDVTVYRLISKGTIEEKILERQQLKQTLADEVIGADTEGFKDLSKEELLSLFQYDSE